MKPHESSWTIPSCVTSPYTFYIVVSEELGISNIITHAIFTSNLAFEGHDHQNEQKNDIFVALLRYIIFSEQWRMITLDISQRCIYINFIPLSRREVIIFSGFFYFFMCNAPRYFKIAQMYLYVVHIKWFWRAKWTQKKNIRQHVAPNSLWISCRYLCEHAFKGIRMVSFTKQSYMRKWYVKAILKEIQIYAKIRPK